MIVTNVRVTDLIKILVKMAAQNHNFVDVEVNSLTNTMKVFPALKPLEVKRLEDIDDIDDTPLDDHILSQLF